MIEPDPTKNRHALGYCLLFGLVYAVQVWVNPERCMSFDSWQYLELARKITHGDWLPALDAPNTLGRAFNPYGLGYPYAIAVTSLGGLLPVIWASKAVNLLLILLGIWRLCQARGFHPLGLLPVFSAQFFFLATHTWSEGMLAGLAMNLAASAAIERKGWIRVLLTSLLIALTRVQGVFLVMGACIGMLVWKRVTLGKATGIILACGGALAAYLGLEALQSGMLTGGERPGASMDAYGYWLAIGYVSLQSFEWVHKDGQAEIVSAVIALAAIGLCYQSLKRLLKKPDLASEAGTTLFSSGLVYFAAAMPLLFFFSFAEGIDQRFLGPGLLLAQMGLLGQFSLKSLKPGWIFWIVIPLAAANLPWRGLLQMWELVKI